MLYPTIHVTEEMYEEFLKRFGKERWHALFRPVFPGQEHLLDRPTEEERAFFVSYRNALPE
jgi:hypothetical protein